MFCPFQTPMTKRCLALVTVALSAIACGKDSTGPDSQVDAETALYLDGARLAWKFVENNTQASTGLSKAHDTYQFVTIWDIASQIAATYSAHELGIIDDGNYDGRIRKILGTLTTMPLFDGAGFNKFYDSETGKMIDRN